MAEFLATATGMIDLVKSGIAIFMEPPLVYFVGLSAAGAGIALAGRFIPAARRKKG